MIFDIIQLPIAGRGSAETKAWSAANTGSARWWSAAMLAAGFVLAQLAGCASSPVGPVDTASALEGLGFLQQPRVSRGEVEGRLGPPASVYEQGRIVTYGLRPKGNGWEVHGDPSHYLVVLYRPDNSVEIWSLVNPVPYR